MPSQTDILNTALALIGAKRVSSIDDGTQNANFCKDIYSTLLDDKLRLHHWNFATGRETLQALVDTPVFEFTTAWGLPGDFIKLREYYDDQVGFNLSADWSIYGNQLAGWASKFRIELVQAGDETTAKKIIVSNATVVSIVYTKRVINPDLWDPSFARAISTLLASDLASAISHNDKRAESLFARGNALMDIAMGMDGQEQSNEPFIVNDLIWGR